MLYEVITKIEVYVIGEKLNAGGVLVDFGEIKAHLAEVMKKLDHKFLNELDYFPDGNPSSENIAYFVITSYSIHYTKLYDCL